MSNNYMKAGNNYTNGRNQNSLLKIGAAVLVTIIICVVIYFFFLRKKDTGCAAVKGVRKFSDDGKCTTVDCYDGYSLANGSCTECKDRKDEYTQNSCSKAKKK